MYTFIEVLPLLHQTDNLEFMRLFKVLYSCFDCFKIKAKSKIQSRCVLNAPSSIDAKFIAPNEAIKELLYLCRLFQNFYKP